MFEFEITLTNILLVIAIILQVLLYIRLKKDNTKFEDLWDYTTLELRRMSVVQEVIEENYTKELVEIRNKVECLENRIFN